MLTDLITLMEFEAGNLTEKEIIIMIGQMVESGEIESMPHKFERLAKRYVNSGVMDEEGNINYIKIRELE